MYALIRLRGDGLMLVGKADVNIRELVVRCKKEEELLNYMDSLVPEGFRHIRAIVDNQRYICCLYIRASKVIPWDVKKDLLNNIMSKLTVVGYTNILIETSMLYSIANMDRIEKYYRKEKM